MSVTEKAAQMVQADTNSLSPSAAGAAELGSVLSGGGSDPSNNSVQAWVTLADALKRWDAEAAAEPSKTAGDEADVR